MSSKEPSESELSSFETDSPPAASLPNPDASAGLHSRSYSEVAAAHIPSGYQEPVDASRGPPIPGGFVERSSTTQGNDMAKEGQYTAVKGEELTQDGHQSAEEGEANTANGGEHPAPDADDAQGWTWARENTPSMGSNAVPLPEDVPGHELSELRRHLDKLERENRVLKENCDGQSAHTDDCKQKWKSSRKKKTHKGKGKKCAFSQLLPSNQIPSKSLLGRLFASSDDGDSDDSDPLYHSSSLEDLSCGSSSSSSTSSDSSSSADTDRSSSDFSSDWSSSDDLGRLCDDSDSSSARDGGEAYRFYLQQVASNLRKWTLKGFYRALMDECFPSDMVDQMRREIDNFKQGSRSVKEYTSALQQKLDVMSTIGKQEHISKLWKGFHLHIQASLIKDRLNSNTSTWKEVVEQA
ncbi:hypothetical protein BDN71DRAFT_1512750 [Pleurotus eryngii]|uniref:Retrotransposon gag domain-containing protein n=1 Tax=Pleurotus eryngii TaxID=5323 RepID=A0A9P6DAK7_PLEER|nr:hypothetical protein BDN71DRAFT_1512750 [Pleurotus eryngii]